MIKTEYENGLSPSLASDIMLLLQSSSPENALVYDMISKAKRNYVSQHHSLSIFQLHSTNKYMDGKWKTHVYIDGKRKGVTFKQEDELYEYLYQHYKAQEDAPTTFADVFQIFLEEKKAKGRASKTITEDERRFRYLDESIQNKTITDITEEDLLNWISSSFMTREPKPKPEGLKKMVQFLSAVFDCGRRKKVCRDNPAEFIDFHDYLHLCNLETKSNEEHSFSEDDLQRLKESAMKDIKSPHGCMLLVSMETGLRIGELAPLQKSDIKADYIHVHRQQVKQEKDENHEHQFFYDVDYTKNERQNPKNGRRVPISDLCAEALRYASEIPGDSKYVFHHRNGNPVQKDSFGTYLRRKCHKLGIDITHNHAFRVAYNARLIEKDLDANDRCLILGHSMQTNERHYSFSDERRFESIQKKLKAN